MSRTAVYPGTFDPVTNGHLDLIKRGTELFDQVIVAVAHNPGKSPLFTVRERVGFLQSATLTWKNITIDSFDTLLIEYVKKQDAGVIIKGLRAISDFEYELQLSLMNRKLDSSIETVFMMPSEEFSFLSSRIIKEVAHLGGDVSNMVPEPVFLGLKRKFKL